MQIVWFSEIKWDYLKTRKQQIISRRPAGTQLLFLEPYVRGRRNTFRLRTEGDVFCATVPFVKSAPTFPWRTILDRRLARSFFDFITRARITGLLRDLRFPPQETGFIISNIYAADIAFVMKRRFVLYDCNDDHASFPGMRDWTKAYFYKTSRNVDAVFASSRALLKKVREVRGEATTSRYLGNGVDFAHFQNGSTADAKPAAPPAKPRLGYIGALAPWVDFDALADVARRHGDWEIVLVGPVLHGANDALLRLTALPNVFHLPAVPYDRLPDIVRQFTVGLIPFRYNELTRGVNPNKLYEYLAAGLPVVTTRFSEEVQGFPDLVRAVDPGDAFVEACEKTLAVLQAPGGVESVAARARETAKQNDWNVIAETFWDRVKQLMDGGGFGN